MDEYINREAVYEYFDKCNSENPKWTPSRVKTLISRQKAADVAPVRHGRWIYNIESGEYVCSACGENALSFRKDTFYGVDLYETCLTDYCPNFGAKMDEEEV